jgi:DNA-binding CsgD family transcriptional regulator/tetratricopeptide (TPR) repeat protein
MRLSRQPEAEHHAGRGRAYGVLGEFDLALADLETAVDEARKTKDKRTEWLALSDLGMLWASRDYSKTGEYYREAFALAERGGVPDTLARSLNRLGNWHVNTEQPAQACEYHGRAFTAFDQIQDDAGKAETLDFLGLANLVKGDLPGAVTYFEKAAKALSGLGDQERLASSLALLTLRGGAYQVDSVAPASPGATSGLRHGEEALRISREIGWRAGESFTLSMLASVNGWLGRYGEALACARTGLAIAEEIGHLQWSAAARCVLGAIYVDLMEFESAKSELETALALARHIRSLYWTRTAADRLAQACVGMRHAGDGERVAKEALDGVDVPQTLAGRQVWCALAEATLASGRPEHALAIMDRMPGPGQGAGIPGEVIRVRMLHGEALAALGRLDQSEAELRAAARFAAEQSAAGARWRADAALGGVLKRKRRWAEATRQSSRARSVVEALAGDIADESLRVNFIGRALSWIPASRPPSRRDRAKAESGGLTARERQIAALIARGMSNRAIAGELILAERTVTTHVANIMSKLGFTSRTQIAAWIAEKGPLQPSP